MTVADMKQGTEACVSELQGETSFQDRLRDLGFLPGTKIRLIRKSFLGDPLEVRLRGYHLAIRKSDAKKILLADML